MKRIETNSRIPAGLVALALWRKQVGVSAPTAWRWKKRGWLQTVEINGRPYVTAQAAEEFLDRAGSGKFARLQQEAAK